jgi:peptidoglycan hydrolase-like protein with peptidoglycan-binding domain
MFPGAAIKLGDRRPELVRLVQDRLNVAGCGPLLVDGEFGPATKSAVCLFQTRRGLEADGIIGPISWGALFLLRPQAIEAPDDPFAKAVLDVARSQIGVREEGGANRGPQVEKYLAAVGRPPGDPWCLAFTFYCVNEGAKRAACTNPLPITASGYYLWTHVPDSMKIPASAPLEEDLRRVKPGMIFIIDHGNQKTHVGLVVSATVEGLASIEGNTNIAGSREGDGVYARTRRFAEITHGYIDFTASLST